MAAWWEKPLEALSASEWEALCDGCGQCCLLKLEDDTDGAVHYTRVACQLLDDETCRCSDYPRRFQRVPGCVRLTVASLRESGHWMPRSCAYRLRAEGRPLPEWHPLRTGDRESVHRAGVSVRGRTVPEGSVAEDDLEDFVIPDLH
jgi:uncharacterized cysteine cluster protein YcgN (CxxCxxCC family)